MDLERDDIELLKVSVDPESLLRTLGFSINKETHKDLRGSCLVHGGDNTSAFRFNKENYTWTCFSNKCHEQYGNDVVGLIMAVNKISFSEAVTFLADFVGDSRVTKESVSKYKATRERKSFIRDVGILQKPDIVNEDFLKECIKFRSNFFYQEGFSKKTLDFFEVAGGYVDKIGHARDIIPIRNDVGELVAYSFRDVTKKCNEDFKYLATDLFDKDRVLYNLHNAKVFGAETPLIVVEGFKSVWRLHDFGFYNCVSIMGSLISHGQLNLLLAYALKGVIIMFDNDKPGKKGTDLALKMFKNKLKSIPVYIKEETSEGKGLDPSDLTLDQFLAYVEAL